MIRASGFLLVALSTTAMPAWAQTTPAPTSAKAALPPGDDIIVTARRHDERLIDTPVAITAVSGAKLNQYAVTSVSDLGTQVPSLIAGKASSGSSASIFLRGVGSTALSAGFDQSVSFVIDGLAMSRGREISLPQFDVQQVEVLKGPQALYFGKNTTGGLISITSNNPTDKFEAGIKGGYEFYARQRYVEGYVSGPISDTLKVRIAGRYSKSDGAFTNTAADTYTNYIPGQERVRNSDRRGFGEDGAVRGTVVWEPSPNARFTLKAGYSSVQDGGGTDIIERLCPPGRTAPFPASGLPASPNADCKVNGRSDQSAIPTQVADANYRYARDGHMYGDFKSEYAILTGNITSDPFDLTTISGFYHFRQTDLNNVSGEAYPAGFSELTDFKQYSEEVRLQSKFDGPFNLMFGMYYAHGDFTFNTDAYIAPVPLDPTTNTYVSFKRNDGFSSDSLSGFAQGTLKLGQQVELSGGARYSLESRDSYQQSLPANAAFAAAFPGDIRIDDRYRDHNLSPEATLRWKPSTDTTLYASYKQGFKAGGFNISQTLTPGVDDGTGRFGSEKARGEEVGLRTLLLDRRLSFNLTAYNYTYKDLQVQFFDPTTTGEVSGNAGKLVTRGVEAEFNYRVPGVRGLSFRGAGAYNQAKFHDYIGQCFSGQTIAEGCNLAPIAAPTATDPNAVAYTQQNYGGRTAPKAPHFAGRLGATLEVPVSASGMRAVLNSDVSYTSRYNYSDALEPFAVQKAYTKIDASLALVAPNNRWTLSVIGRNLTNKLVVTTSNDIPFAGGTGTGTAAGVASDLDVYVENPREVFLELSVKF
ncbi:TonB-dependent receptor [Sphingomonas sp. CGMCC 1.13654]|uniref:TonB-dependent receptor n=1 Tax=Sphingomonas chungangi TaxID=2683589 RepID=A0A838L320_9SPHN|nr:TonB-dependent receptor [Sphingomonas chungangi]MBA2933791.1 TonB-dependent receptor [Sphingomonas chungangi]MVW55121.1 TonB-dependent receptor [Sphingomonas chungangi]